MGKHGVESEHLGGGGRGASLGGAARCRFAESELLLAGVHLEERHGLGRVVGALGGADPHHHLDLRKDGEAKGGWGGGTCL